MRLRKLLTAITFIGIIGLHTGSAMAGGGYETFTLGRSNYATTANTSWAEKESDSSVFARCMSVSYESSLSMTSCTGLVQASNSNATTATGLPLNNPTYTFSLNKEHRMINYVKEQGYKYTRIHFKGAANSFYTTFTFCWWSY